MLTNNGFIFLILFFTFLLLLFKFGHNKQKEFFFIFSILMLLLNYINIEEFIKSYFNTSLLTIFLLLIISTNLKYNYFFIKLTNKINTDFKLFFLSAGISSFLNNITVVSGFLELTNKNKRKLILLSFGAIIGGTLTAIGTSTNIIANEILLSSTNESINSFIFAKFGIPILLISSLFVYIISKINLNESKENFKYFFELKISNKSKMIGKTIKENKLRNLNDFYIAEIIRNEKSFIPNKETIIKENDIFILVGNLSKINELPFLNETKIINEHKQLDNIKEIIISEHFKDIGLKIKDINFREKYNMSILSIYRNNRRIELKIGDIELEEGDMLIVLDNNKTEYTDLIYVNTINIKHEKLNKKDSIIYLSLFISSIALALFKIIPIYIGLSMTLIYFLYKKYIVTANIKEMNFNFLIIIGAGLVISKVFKNTGIDSFISINILNFELETFTFIIILFIISIILTELFSNAVTVAIMIPIALSMFGFNEAAIMAVIFGANASFLIPYGYHTNIVIYNYGNFSLKEFIKLGFIMTLIYSFVFIGLIKIYYF